VSASLAARLGITNEDLWYASRGSGVVLLVLLSLAVVLGVAVRSGWAPGSTLRFVVEGLHRNVALVGVALLVVHVVTAELDPFVTIGWVAAVVPFASPYRGPWIGLGAVSLDLALAITATSLVRRFLGYRTWRAVHILAYAAWPAAFVHSLRAGNDTRVTWVAATMWACAAGVAVAVAARLAGEKPAGRWSRRAVDNPTPAPATVPLPAATHKVGGRRRPLAATEKR